MPKLARQQSNNDLHNINEDSFHGGLTYLALAYLNLRFLRPVIENFHSAQIASSSNIHVTTHLWYFLQLYHTTLLISTFPIVAEAPREVPLDGREPHDEPERDGGRLHALLHHEAQDRVVDAEGGAEAVKHTSTV